MEVPPGSYVTPDGKRTLSAAQVKELSPADQDWFPASHPTPPDVVLRETRKGLVPCAECHLVNGQGEVGIPDLAGLREDYLVEQLRAFRAGTRRSAQAGRIATEAMIGIAKAMTEEELQAAAAQFAGLPRHDMVRVVVSENAPAMHIERFGWTYADSGAGRRALEGSVAESPESLMKVFLGDTSNREVVYAARATLA